MKQKVDVTIFYGAHIMNRSSCYSIKSAIPRLESRRGDLRAEVTHPLFSFPCLMRAKWRPSSIQAVVDADVDYPTPSEGFGHGEGPWSPISRATPQDLHQRS